MSSDTRKNAWSSSVSQPRVAVRKCSFSSRGRESRREVESGTERPRLHFPPMVLWYSDWREEMVSFAINWIVTRHEKGLEWTLESF